MRRAGLSAVAVAVLSLGVFCPVPAGENEAEIGLWGGFFAPDVDVSGKPQNFDHIEPIGGLRGGYLFTDHLGWFLDGTFSNIHSSALVGFGDVETIDARTGLELFFRPHQRKQQFYVAFGGGAKRFTLETPPGAEDNFDRTFASLSIGQRWKLDERARLRWELRGDATLSDDGFNKQDITIAEFLVGVSWRLGKICGDTDADGVCAADDDCPDTPRGCTVDRRGCSMDEDRDGVCDGIDECPGTPFGATVDERGCPSDSDGDGVYDGIDQCPNTPRGATVDSRGCPSDSDGDGVYNGIDRCPNTPRGATVDSRGCPSDSDGDGVYDGIDRCPNTRRGCTVDAFGCPSDGDGDGVCDGIDQCPNTPRGAKVDAVGCSAPVALPQVGGPAMVLEGVNFEFNSATLTARSSGILDRVAGDLRRFPEVRILIAGHTDSRGDNAYNQNLSERRAASVRAYLIGKGIAADRMRSAGYGEDVPLIPNAKTEQEHFQNRRVELTRLD